VTPAAFLEAATGGDPATVRAALLVDPDLARTRNEAGVSVVALTVYAGRLALAREIAAERNDLDLFEASCVGALARVEAQLGAGNVDVEAVSPDGFRPLGFAAFFGHLPLLERLLALGAEVNAASRNSMKVCALHSAAAHGEPRRAIDLARPLLVAGADPNARQQGGHVPLHEVALGGNRELAELLLAHGADPRAATDAGETPAELARQQGHNALAAWLGELAAAQESAGS